MPSLLAKAAAWQARRRSSRSTAGGARPPDRHAARQIGDAGRHRRREAAPQPGGEHGDHGVARARHVEHLARLRFEMPGAAVGRDQRHAVGPARDQHEFGAGVGQRARRRRAHLLVGFRHRARGPREFAAIGRERRGAAIAGEIRALGIDDHGNAGVPRRADRGLDHVAREHALGVIREDQHIDAVEAVGDDIDDASAGDVVHRALGLPVGPQQLLAARHIARLDGGPPPALDQQVGLDRALLADHGDQVPADLVVAHRGDETNLGPQRDQVARHIARPAQHGLVGADADHRHRRLGRDALDLAVDEAVEHQIADHHDVGAGQGLDGGGEIGCAGHGDARDARRF